MDLSITQRVQSFSKFKILIIGDVMIDSYLWGKVDRISPEAPVPIIMATNQENRLGGAANVALNIQSLGATPVLCAICGDDERSGTLHDLLTQGRISAEGIMTDPGRTTTVKTRIISNNQHLLRVDRETDQPLSPAAEARFIERIETVIQQHAPHAIIFEDYDKGAITPGIIKRVVDLAIQAGIPTLVDPKKRNFAHYKGVSLFKPNFKELVEGMKIEADKNDPGSLRQAALSLHNDWKIEHVLVTLSEAGVFISSKERHHHIPAEVRDIADVSGAGDTVIGTASLCLASGMSPLELATVANIAGGLVCEKVGVVPIDRDQLLEEIKVRGI